MKGNLSVTHEDFREMVGRLRLRWKRQKSGYEIIQFDPNLVDIERPQRSAQKKHSHTSLPPPKPILRDSHGAPIRHGDEDHLAPSQVISPIGNQVEKFEPIEEKHDLYLAFANTRCSTGGILEFASEHGLLTTGDEHETVDMWRYHITNLNQAIAKWNRLKDGKAVAFAKVYRDLCPHGADSLKHSLEIGSSGTPQVFLEPVNLLAAMWLQFAAATEGATTFSPCQECSVWIDTVPGSNRPDKKYCSDACKMRAYRKRKIGR
jgi:hypothetical protein